MRVEVRPELLRRTFRERLRRYTPLRGRDLDLACDFLLHLLRVDARDRPSAREASRHAWIR